MKGRTLMISRSPRRTVTGARKLCLAEAIIRLRTRRSPLRARFAVPSVRAGRTAVEARSGIAAKETSLCREMWIAAPIRAAPVRPVSALAQSPAQVDVAPVDPARIGADEVQRGKVSQGHAGFRARSLRRRSDHRS